MSKHSYVLSMHGMLFQKFELDIPQFEKYDNEYKEVVLNTKEERLARLKYYYEDSTRHIANPLRGKK